jgi:hypothetical protein
MPNGPQSASTKCSPTPIGRGSAAAHAHDGKTHAHLAPNYVAETIRAHFPTLGIGDDGKVVSL